MALIAGPTASGKSGLALALARRTPCVIINMDASQVYADLRVLTARPTAEQEAAAPHRLFGHIDGAEACTAARWASDARDAITHAHAIGHLPILVGGTGLYLRTLLDGIAPVPEIDSTVRATVRAMSVAQAYASLTTEDHHAALRLAPTDTTRVARALEVVRSTGRSLKSWQQEKVGGIGDDIRLSPLLLLPPREWLLERCDVRLEDMMASGALDEVQALLARALDPDLPVMRAIGVREIAAMLAGSATREATLAATQHATRQYAKRQFTWFRNQCPRDWPSHNEILNHQNSLEIVIKLHNTVLTA